MVQKSRGLFLDLFRINAVEWDAPRVARSLKKLLHTGRMSYFIVTVGDWEEQLRKLQ